MKEEMFCLSSKETMPAEEKLERRTQEGGWMRERTRSSTAYLEALREADAAVMNHATRRRDQRKRQRRMLIIDHVEVLARSVRRLIIIDSPGF